MESTKRLVPKGDKEYVGSTDVSFKRRYNHHKYNMSNNKGQQTTLSKFYRINKNSNTDIRWSILYKVREYVHNKSDNCSICNLERIETAEFKQIIKYKKSFFPYFKYNYL